MIKHCLSILSIVILFTSCIKRDFIPPADYSTSNLDGTTSFSDSSKFYLEGIYELTDGDKSFDIKLVGKWKHGTFCLFGEQEGMYMNLEVGFKPSDSSFRMSGLWRSPIHVEQGAIEFTIAKEEGATAILNKQSQGIVMRGNMNGNSITLTFQRPFSAKVLARNFILLAHRAGGRNSDNLPYAENSLKLLQYSEKLGATGVEMDIRLTKDNIPVIYHDADINTRLTQKSPLVGNINQFNFSFLNSFIKLVDGQSIPTLDEMLNTAIDSTELQYVWLDCKDGGSANFFNVVVPVVQKAIERAHSKNRDITILFGLPTDDAYDSFLEYPNHENLPSLCELSLEKAKNAGSKVFAPRWTLGILSNDTEEAHARNMKIFTWTLDDEGGMDEVITKSEYDGILTNYPSMLTYEFYSQD